MDQKLAEEAQKMVIPSLLEWPWQLLLRAINTGWIDRDDLAVLIEALKSENFGGYTVDEFHIAPNWSTTDEFNVRFLDEAYLCPKPLLRQQLEELQERLSQAGNQST